jgi:hypothetical protein
MATYDITNVRVLDGTGREPFTGRVRVEGNRIDGVMPGVASPPAGDTTVIDGAGATLTRAP